MLVGVKVKNRVVVFGSWERSLSTVKIGRKHGVDSSERNNYEDVVVGERDGRKNSYLTEPKAFARRKARDEVKSVTYFMDSLDNMVARVAVVYHEECQDKDGRASLEEFIPGSKIAGLGGTLLVHAYASIT